MKTDTSTLLVIALLLIHHAYSFNILGIFPYQGKTHFFQFRVYLRELANRGHNVTVISYFPEEEPPPNYHDIVIGETKILGDSILVHKSYLTVIATGIYLTYFGTDNCKALVASEAVQHLVTSKPKFDVVVFEQFNSDCALGIAYKLGAPTVGITTNFLMPFHYARYGIPDNPAYVSFRFLEGGTKPSLYQRVERIFFGIYFKLLYKYVQWNDRNTLMDTYGDIPPLENLAREIKFLLLYQHNILSGSNILPANVIEIGGYHVPKAKPLTADLKNFFDEAEHGIILISFGSMLKSSTMPSRQRQAILGAINELPQRFIFRWDDASLYVNTNKVYISDWLPQVDILAHPKTLAFVSHAGMGGTTESIHYGVPMVAVPLFGDQPANALAIAESGLGVHLDFNELNRDSLLAALRKVLQPEFQKQAKDLSRAWHDRPMSPLDTAVYWTEFAARNANFTFRAAAADTPLYQHMYLDVAAVFILTLLIIYTVKILINIVCKYKKSTHLKNFRHGKRKGTLKEE